MMPAENAPAVSPNISSKIQESRRLSGRGAPVFFLPVLHIYEIMSAVMEEIVVRDDFTCDTSVNLPYPATQPESKNRTYALAMLSNIGGGNSEMTAVSLYFYNSVILDPAYAGFAKCFHEISLVEMRHLDIFAELAYKMGMDPRLWSIQNQKRTYWTPAYNQYPRAVHNVIQNAIQGENAAIRKYRSQAGSIRDDNIVAILQRIILDEERHIEIFNGMLHYLSQN